MDLLLLKLCVLLILTVNEHSKLTLQSTIMNNTLNFTEKAREDTLIITTPQENPYAVLILKVENEESYIISSGVCSGSLLTPDWVLTAAHCLYKEHTSDEKHLKFLIYAGGNSLEEAIGNVPMPEEAQKSMSYLAFPHPKYRNLDYPYDIGLIKLEFRFNLSNVIRTIQIATQPWVEKSYVSCKTTTFGVAYSNKDTPGLDFSRKTQKSMISPCKCRRAIRMITGTSDWLCSLPQEDYGICWGDSGGGLVCDGHVVGVNTLLVHVKTLDSCWFGEEEPQCGTKNTMSMFTVACHHARWIYSHVKTLNKTHFSEDCWNWRPDHSSVRVPQVLFIIYAILILLVL